MYCESKKKAVGRIHFDFITRRIPCALPQVSSRILIPQRTNLFRLGPVDVLYVASNHFKYRILHSCTIMPKISAYVVSVPLNG